MKKKFYACLIVFISLICEFPASAQSLIKGRILEGNVQTPVYGASILIKKLNRQTLSRRDGSFSIAAPKSAFKITVSKNGYQTAEKDFNGNSKNITIVLKKELPEEKISAATPLVSGRINPDDIVKNPSASFYNELAVMPGVFANTQSFLFNSVNTGGFNSIENSRFLETLDGMDSRLPGFNFAAGSVSGISDIDVAEVNLISGTGAANLFNHGMNGTLAIRSKDPFTYPGLSAQYRVGLNHPGNTGQAQSPFEDMSLRYARVLNNRLAVKATLSYAQGTDWQSQNVQDFDRIQMRLLAGTRNSNPAYDGVNVYGDEQNPQNPTLKELGLIIKNENAGIPCGCIPEPARSIVKAYNLGLLENHPVTRTGYSEQSLTDYNQANSLKTSGSVNYKISKNLEAIAGFNWSKGNSVYTDVDKYALSNFSLGQYKLELKGNRFFVRGYTTQQNLGDSYDISRLGGLINESWESTPVWMRQYLSVYAQARLAGSSDMDANSSARAAADSGMPQPGSAEFNTLKNDLSASTGGSRLFDRSAFYQYEGLYDFSGLFHNKLNLSAGGTFRRYHLNSNGTIFDDAGRDIRLNEYGAYALIAKNITSRLNLSASLNADRSENFETVFSPGFTGTYSLTDKSSLSASYALNYRNPDMRNQYLNYTAAGSIQLIGGLPEILNQYNLYSNKPYTAQSYRDYLNNSSTAVLEQYSFNPEGIKPENVQTFALGYRQVLNPDFLISSFANYHIYHNYISNIDVYQNPDPGSPAGLQNMQRFFVPVNDAGEITSWGVGLGLQYNLNKLVFSGNAAYNDSGNLPVDDYNGFNTPKIMMNAGVGSNHLGKRAGFNIIYRWQDEFQWRSAFVNGRVPAYGTLDGQFSFKLPQYNSVLKIGGSNILNRYYSTSFGNPEIGGIYYVSVLFNEFSK